MNKLIRLRGDTWFEMVHALAQMEIDRNDIYDLNFAFSRILSFTCRQHIYTNTSKRIARQLLMKYIFLRLIWFLNIFNLMRTI